MTHTHDHSILANNHYDPTRTTALRNAFARDIKKRFLELAKVIKTSIVDNDCFALKSDRLTVFQMNPTPVKAFAFARDEKKLIEFLKWLEKQIDAGILTVRDIEQIGSGIDALWTNKYIYDSYKRGVMRARGELIRAGFDVPSIEATGGIAMVMGLPMHIDRLGLLYTRTYTELKGITAAMDAKISRILAQGIADGDSPVFLAKKIVSAINGIGEDLTLTSRSGRTLPALRRAEILARTEIIRAHHIATIQEYRNWGLEGIIVKGEWKTAGDARVCSLCAELEGKIFTLDEIEPLIPLHPQCRCIALPYIEELETIVNEIKGGK